MLVMAAIGGVVLRMRVAGAKKRLAEIDSGRRCLSCDGNEVLPAGDGRVRCAGCGYTTSIASLQKHAVSQEEIAKLNEPPSNYLP